MINCDEQTKKRSPRMDSYNIEETIALDLGTSNSCCYYFKDGDIHILDTENGDRIVPSALSFQADKILIGLHAKRRIGYKDTAFEMKRILGRKYDDPIVQECVESWPFLIEANEKGLPVAVLKSEKEVFRLKPVDFYTYIINYFKNQVKQKIEREVKNIILTVPAYFGEHQRKATTFAAKAADLNVVYLMNEPTAAAIAYACENDLQNKTILIYDLGGGTFDVSILKVTNSFDVIATSGDAHLGGIDFTNRLYEIIMNAIRQQVGDIELEGRMKGKLQAIAEETKIMLSDIDVVDVDLSDLELGGLPSMTITREEFNSSIDDLIERSKSVVMDCLSQAGMIPKDIDQVILIGGSSRISAVHEAMASFFDGKEMKANINPDEAVARGAMCFVCQKAGINMVYGNRAVEEGTYEAGDERMVFAPESIEIHDISPMQYVIEIPDDQVDVIVPKGARLPYIEKRYYRTYEDYQSFVNIHIAQGNSMKYSENDEYGELTIDSIPRKPKGEVRIEVVATVDAFCQVSFRAFCNGVPAHLSVNNDQGLTMRDAVEIKRTMEETKLIQLRNQCSKKIEALHKLLETLEDEELNEASDYYEQMSSWFDSAAEATEEDYESAIAGLQSYLDGYQT